jgi:hypothetical protein
MSQRGPGRFPNQGLTEHGYTIQFVKEWRQLEQDAGRPSGFDDFLRAHGLCAECRTTGEQILGWDGEQYLIETCEACGGTGTAKAS